MTNNDFIIAQLIRDLHKASGVIKNYSDLIWSIRDAIHINYSVTAFDPNNPPEPKLVETIKVDKKEWEAYQKIKDLIRNFESP